MSKDAGTERSVPTVSWFKDKLGKLLGDGILHEIGRQVRDNPFRATVHPEVFTNLKFDKKWPTCPIGKALVTKIAWLIDTGSPFDIASVEALGATACEAAERLRCGADLLTANGPTSCKEFIRMQVKQLQENIQPLLLKKSPFVLSVGIRCMELGYDFHWPAYKNPYFILPDGRKGNLGVVNNVPYLFDDDLPLDRHSEPDMREAIHSDPEPKLRNANPLFADVVSLAPAASSKDPVPEEAVEEPTV